MKIVSIFQQYISAIFLRVAEQTSFQLQSKCRFQGARNLFLRQKLRFQGGKNPPPLHLPCEMSSHMPSLPVKNVAIFCFNFLVPEHGKRNLPLFRLHLVSKMPT